MVRQVQCIASIGLQEPNRAALDMHQIDGQIQFEQILDNGPMIMSRLLQEHVTVFKSNVLTDALGKPAKALTTVVKLERWACLKPCVPLQERLRYEPSDVLVLANINPDVKRFIHQLRN